MAKTRKRRMAKILAVLSLAGIMSTMGVATSLTANAVLSTETWNTAYATTTELMTGVTAPAGTLTVKGVSETNGLTGEGARNLVVVAHKVYDFKRNATTGEVIVERTHEGLGFTAQTGDGKTEWGNPDQKSVAYVAHEFAANQSEYKATSIQLTRQANGDYVATNCPAGMYIVNVYNTSITEWYNPLLMSINLQYDGETTNLIKKTDGEVGVNGRFDLMASSAVGYAKKGTAFITVAQTADVLENGTQQPVWEVNSAIPDYVGYGSPKYAINLYQYNADVSATQDTETKAINVTGVTPDLEHSANNPYSADNIKVYVNDVDVTSNAAVTIRADRVEFTPAFAQEHSTEAVKIVVNDVKYDDIFMQTSKEVEGSSGKKYTYTYTVELYEDEETGAILSRVVTTCNALPTDTDVPPAPPAPPTKPLIVGESLKAALDISGNNYGNSHTPGNTVGGEYVVAPYDTSFNYAEDVTLDGIATAWYKRSVLPGSSSDPTPEPDPEHPEKPADYGDRVSINIPFDVLKTDSFGTPLANAVILCDQDDKGTDSTQTTGSTGTVTFSAQGRNREGIIKEQTAPFGYALSTTEYPYTIDVHFYPSTAKGSITAVFNGVTKQWDLSADLTGAITVTPKDNNVLSATIVNDRWSLVDLPTTGGVGTIVFTVAITGVLGIAFYGFVKLRKKVDKE